MNLSIRVYYEDTDCGGVVYYANYLRYFERGRTEYLRERGVDIAAVRDTTGIQFVVAEARLKFHQPGRYNDLLTLETTVGECRRATFTFVHRVLRGEALLVSGETVMAAVDREGRPVRAPVEVLEALQG